MPSNTAIQKTLSTKSTKTKSIKKGSRKKKTKVIVEDIIDEDIIEEEEVEDEVDEDEVEEEVEEEVEDEIVVKKKRRTPTRETVLTSFDDIISSIEKEIQTLREGPAKIKGVKFLRSLNKNLKIVRAKSARVMKTKKKTTRANNANSGFKKPVAISKDLAKFAGWDPKDLRSRVDVTKYICNYINTHDLQKPEDRRIILPDKKLQKLLGFSPGPDTEPLRYYSLQTYLKTHFPKKE